MHPSISRQDVHQAAEKLAHILASAPAVLSKIADAAASTPRSPGGWSAKQILGHLVDSAANNHHRFVRGQYETDFAMPAYQQEAWVDTQRYADRAWPELLLLWQVYNKHLVHLMRTVPAEALDRPCRIGEDAPVTLGFLMVDYVGHLKHHLAQIDGLPNAT